MENISMVSKLFGFILPFLKSKSSKKIGGEISDAFNNEAIAIWDKIKFIFIKEDKEILEDLEKNPEDLDIQGAFKYKLKKLITENAELKSELEKLISKKEIKPKDISVENSKNVNIGNITTRDGSVQIGDNNQK